MLPSPNKIKSALMIAGIGAAIYGVYRLKKTSEKIGEVIESDLNPASKDNVVFKNTPDFIKGGFNSFFAGLDSIGLLPK